jgi:hypothetical protein
MPDVESQDDDDSFTMGTPTSGETSTCPTHQLHHYRPSVRTTRSSGIFSQVGREALVHPLLVSQVPLERVLSLGHAHHPLDSEAILAEIGAWKSVTDIVRVDSTVAAKKGDSVCTTDTSFRVKQQHVLVEDPFEWLMGHTRNQESKSPAYDGLIWDQL